MAKYWNRNVGLVYLFTIVICFIISFYAKESDIDFSMKLSDYQGMLKLYYSFGEEISESNSIVLLEEPGNEEGEYNVLFSELEDNIERAKNEPLPTKIKTVRVDFENFEMDSNFTLEENQFKKGIANWSFVVDEESCHDLAFVRNDNGSVAITITGNDPFFFINLEEIYNMYTILHSILAFCAGNLLFGVGWYLLVFRKESAKVRFLKVIICVCLGIACNLLLSYMETNKQLIINTDGYLGTIKIYLNDDGYSELSTVGVCYTGDSVNIVTALPINEKEFHIPLPETEEYRIDFEKFGDSVSFKINGIGYENIIKNGTLLCDSFKASVVGVNDAELLWKETTPIVNITGEDPFLIVRNKVILSEVREWERKTLTAICCIFLILIIMVIIIPERYIMGIRNCLFTNIESMKLNKQNYLPKIGFLLLLSGVVFGGSKYNYIFNHLCLSMSISHQIALLAIIMTVFWVGKCKLDKSSTCNYVKKSEISGQRSMVFWGILALTVLCAVYMFRLGDENFHNDEHYHVLAAIGYLKTGRFIQWDLVNDIPWEEYTRAWPYTWMIAQSFKLFGVSEISARLVSVACGLVFGAIFYILLNKITGKVYFSTICTVLLGIHPNLVDVFRTVRMYSLMMVCGLLLFICIYQTFHSGNKFKSKNKVVDWISSNFDFHIGYALLSVGLIGFTYLIMPNPLVMVLGVFVFVIIQYIKTKETKYFLLLLFVALAGSGFVLVRIIPDIFPDVISTAVNAVFIHTTNVNGYEQSVQLEYLWAMLSYPWGMIAGTFFFLAGGLIFIKNKEQHVFVRYMFSVIFCTLFFFIFVVHRYFQIRYIMFLLPIIFFVMAVGYYGVYEKFHAAGKTVLNLLLIVVITSVCHYSFGYLYEHKNDNAIFSDAYAELADYWGTDHLLPLYSYHYRSEYLQQFEQVVFQSYIEDEIENLVEFSGSYPNGIISIEAQKYYMHSADMKIFVSKYLNHFAGTGRDDNWVELYEYNFFNPCEREQGTRYEKSFEDMIYYTNGKNKEGDDVLRIMINRRKLLNAVSEADINRGVYQDDDMVFTALKFNGENQEIYCQLMMEGDGRYLYYEIPVEMEEAEMDSEILVYLDNHVVEVTCMEQELEVNSL